MCLLHGCFRDREDASTEGGRVRTSRRDSGFAILTVLLVSSVASALIVGGSSTAASVMNQQDIGEATSQMRYVSGQIRDRTESIEGPEADALRAQAQRMEKVANMLDDSALDDIAVNVRNNLGDAILTPLQGGAVVDAVKFAWDFKSGYELGDTVLKSWGLTDSAADPLIAALQDIRPDLDHTSPVGQAIAEAKLNAARIAVTTDDPGLTPGEIDAAATALVLDIAEMGSDASAGGGPYDNRYLADIGRYLGWDPGDVPEVGDDEMLDDDTAVDAGGGTGALASGHWTGLGAKSNWSEAPTYEEIEAATDWDSFSGVSARLDDDGTFAFFNESLGWGASGTYAFDGRTGTTSLDDAPPDLAALDLLVSESGDTLYVVQRSPEYPLPIVYKMIRGSP